MFGRRDTQIIILYKDFGLLFKGEKIPKISTLTFIETTLQNHRKNGRPNPDQKYFFLIVKLLAETPNGLVVVQSYASDKVIVRASNPGQFEVSPILQNFLNFTILASRKWSRMATISQCSSLQWSSSNWNG